MENVNQTHALKHTPGPWSQMFLNEDHVVYVPGNEGKNTALADVYCPEDSPETEAEANAKLIAAAPSMLNAMQDVFNHLKDPDFKKDQLNRIYCIGILEAAIKLATE